MKTSIPDSGTVTRLDGENAMVRMKHDGSCRKCGAAALGLCKGGLMQELTVRNPLQARVGDTVKIGLERRVHYRGYVLAYVVPAVAFLCGAVAGHYLGAAAGFSPLEVIGGFSSLIVISFFSFRRLRRLDASHAIEIVHVASDPWCPGIAGDGELTTPEQFIDQAGSYSYR